MTHSAVQNTSNQKRLDSLTNELRDARYAMINARTRAEVLKHRDWYIDVKARLEKAVANVSS